MIRGSVCGGAYKRGAATLHGCGFIELCDGADRVAAVFLGLIHGGIGAPHHAFPAALRGVELGDAGADGKADWLVLEGNFEGFHGLPDALGCHDARRGGGVGQQDGELFASGAGQHIVDAHHGFDLVAPGPAGRRLRRRVRACR